MKTKAIRRKIINNTTEINKVCKTKSWLFKKIQNTDNTLDRLRKKREKTQITIIRNERGTLLSISLKKKKIMRIL